MVRYTKHTDRIKGFVEERTTRGAVSWTSGKVWECGIFLVLLGIQVFQEGTLSIYGRMAFFPHPADFPKSGPNSVALLSPNYPLYLWCSSHSWKSFLDGQRKKSKSFINGRYVGIPEWSPAALDHNRFLFLKGRSLVSASLKKERYLLLNQEDVSIMRPLYYWSLCESRFFTIVRIFLSSIVKNFLDPSLGGVALIWTVCLKRS